MKCENCGIEKECYIVPIYYAVVLGSESNTHNEILKSTTTTVTRYGEVKKRDYKICEDCATLIQKRSLQMRPIYSLIILICIGLIAKLVELLGFITINVFNIILYILCGLFIILLASSIIGLVRKNYLKVYKVPLFLLVKKLLNKELKKESKKTRFEFWDKYPSHLKLDKR